MIWDHQPSVDLSLLRGLPLKLLALSESTVRDLTPIRDLPVEQLWLEYRAEQEPFLRSLIGLKWINSKPVDEFWASDGAK